MADTAYVPGDGIHEILRKILERLNEGLQTSGGEPPPPPSGGETAARGSAVVLAWQPTLSTPAYSSLDVFGGGPVELSGAFRPVTGDTPYSTSILQNITIVDREGMCPELELIFFSDVPAGTFTDNQPPVWGSNDRDRIVARATVTSGDYVRVASGTDQTFVASVTGYGQVLRSIDQTNTKLYMVVLTLSAPVYTLTNAVHIKIGLLQN